MKKFPPARPFAHGRLHQPADQFGSARVRRVRLDHHRTTGGEGRRGVAARNGIGQGEIARAKNRHRTEGHEQRTQVGPRLRLAVGIRMVYPAAGAQSARGGLAILPQLKTRPHKFALQPRDRQGGFQAGARNNIPATDASSNSAMRFDNASRCRPLHCE